MDNLKTLRITVVLSILTGLLLILIAYLFSLLDDSFYEFVGEKLGYKFLLTLLMLLLLSLIMALYYYRSIIKSIFYFESKQQKSSNKIDSVSEKINTGKDNPEKIVNHKIQVRPSKQEIINYLKHLSKDEKLILNKYIDNQEKTMILNILDPGLYRLIDAGILNSKPSFLGIPTDFDINMDAWIFLNKNPEYLEIEESN